jgi:hypothetical protein
VANAVVTSGSASYTFEVATDTGFATKVYTKSGVAQTSSQTSLAIDRLNAGADYYWRARAESNGTAGPFSAGRKLTIGPAVQIDPPTLLTPANGATTQGWPGFTVRNSTRSGPAGSVVYRFEVSTTNTFANILLTATVAEANTNTTYVPLSTTAAPPQNALFWRVTAVDQTNNVSSPVSAFSGFTFAAQTQQAQLAAQQGLALWPNAQPTGTTGNARMGPNWQLQTLRSFDGVTFVSPPIRSAADFRSARSRLRPELGDRLHAAERLSINRCLVSVGCGDWFAVSVHGVHQRRMGAGDARRRVIPTLAEHFSSRSSTKDTREM